MSKKAATGFFEIARKTRCPYAYSAKVILGPAWERELSSEENIKNIASDLSYFCRIAYSNKLHGFAMEIVDAEGAQHLEEVKRLLYSILKTLNKYDPDSSNCMDIDITAIGWQFEFANTRLFVSVFAPCYPEHNPRHSYIKDRVFIFFQPDFSFDLCGINKKNRRVKEYVRKLFRMANCPYNGDLVDKRVEAFLYLKPIALDDPPVRWWE